MPLLVEHPDWLDARNAVDIVRQGHVADRIVFVGGHPGCGKSLMTTIVGSLAGVEIQKYNYTLEHLCALSFLGKIDDSTAAAMVGMQTDMDLYNIAMSRETNFRITDCSSVFQNPGPWRYIRRLFQVGDAAAVERIKATKPMLHILTHNLLVLSPTLFKAFGNRMRMIEVVRHPLYMIRQWFLYIERYGSDPRDFTVCFRYHGHILPFFVRGWEERYLRACPMDRSIYSISHLSDLGEQVLRNYPEPAKAQFLRVPFERFVLDPEPYLRQIETLLGTTVTRLTLRELKRQRVPRKMIADSMPLALYRLYGWEPPRKGANERDELKQRRDVAATHATLEAMEVLDRMSSEYEDTYLQEVL